MKKSVDKWKLGVLKVKAKESASILSNINNGEEATLNGVLEETKDMEIASYLTSLKKKTSLKNLWSGQTFYDIVDGDQTPDISSESDSELNLKMSKNVHELGNLHLDSDEDEMRINYIRELKEIDENNNIVSSSESSYNVMGNIHYAQLELDDVQLSADNKLENTNDSLDFLPVLHNIREENPKTYKKNPVSNEDSISIGSASEISEVISNSQEDKKKKVSYTLTTENVSDINFTQSLNHSVSDLSHSKSSIHTFKKKNAKTDFSKSFISGDTFSEGEQKITDTSLSKTSSKKKSKPAMLQTSRTNSEVSNTLDSDRHYSSPSSKSSSHTLNSSISHKSVSNLSSTRSKISKKKKSRSQSGHSGNEEMSRKNMNTQTDFRSDDKTKEVLNYLYSWQLPQPSNIASHVMDADTIELYSNLNPSMLAANDMMKYHLHLVRMHLSNSRRLYESYANESMNNNYNYTSVEETMAFINQNSPKVISYEQALKRVKSTHCK